MSCCHEVDGYPLQCALPMHGYGTLSLDVYTLFIYNVIGVCHPERGSAMNLMKTTAQWESCRHRTANVGERGGSS